MRASVRSLLVLAVVVVAAIGWAQPRERTGEVSPDKAAAVKAATKNIEGAMGTVLLLGMQDSFLMKTSDGYLIAHHGPEFYNLGIMRGDEVAVWGVQRPVEKNPFNNEIDASKVEKKAPQ